MISQILVAGGPFLLTLMGIFIAVLPPSSRGRWVWLTAFVLVGVTTFIATLGEMQATDFTNSDTNLTVHNLKNENLVLRSNLEKIKHSLGFDRDSPLGSVLAKIDALTPHTMNVSGGATFNVPPVSGEISIHTVANRPTKVVLPSSPYRGERLDIIDSVGNASGSKPIIVEGNGYKINGYPAYYLPFARQSITVSFDGDGWGIN